MITRRATLQLLTAATAGAQSFYYGKDEPLPRQMELSAGPLTAVFEPELGLLRYVKFGDAEILRAIYAAVRDRNWGTVAPKISNVKLETADGGFQLTFDVSNVEGPIDFAWRGTITGDPKGSIRFAMEGEARSTFARNRLGFAVLHPIRECAGRMCTVMHGGGSKEIGKFPLEVAPNQPFKDMRSISHEVAPGLTAEVAFEGEIFEMEDHRNWTDGSYKTYCTPLELPFPVEVPKGKKVSQAVTVTLQGTLPAAPVRFVPRRKLYTLDVAGGAQAAMPLPRVGFGLSPESPALDGRQIQLLLAARPAHLRADGKDLARAIQEHRILQAPLELAIHLGADPEAELQTLAKMLAAQKPKIDRCLVFHTGEKSSNAKWAALARETLKGMAASFGAGTNAYFAELNRERPETAPIDFLTFSLNPQVHAFDNASLVENLEAQADAVTSARRFAGGKNIVVSPVTFKPRFNPNATAGEEAPRPDTLPSTADPRQLSLFGAAWTLGSLKYLAESGAHSATYYETHGARGLMETAAGSRWPKLFASRAGQVFPLYHVLADFNEFAGGDVLRTRSSQPLAVDGMILRRAGRQRALIANMTAEPLTVRVAWPSASRRVRMRKLDEYSVREATLYPESWRAQPGDAITLAGPAIDVPLAAYGIVRLDTAEA